MSALSRGLISRLRILSLNPATATTTTTSSAPATYHILRRFCSDTQVVDASKKERTPIIHAKPSVMAGSSVRTGLIAFKCGMTALWDKWGARIPITLLWVDDNIVSQVKTIPKEGINALQVRFFILHFFSSHLPLYLFLS